MTFLGEALRVELTVLVACFAAVVAWKLVRGVARLPQGPKAGGALRLQMLAASLAVATYYLAQLPQSAETGDLPTLPGYALALLAGSQAAFFAPSVRRLLRPIGNLKHGEGK